MWSVTMSASEKAIHPHLHQHAPSILPLVVALADFIACAPRIVSLIKKQTIQNPPGNGNAECPGICSAW